MPVPGQKPVILVVEDNPLNMKLAEDLLTLHGYEVLKAADGEAALRAVAGRRPDLVLLDIHLPGMDGLEVFKRLRADPATRSLRIAALTASAMREEAEAILALGFDGYIPKPIDTRRFIAQIASWLDGSPPSGPAS